MFAYVLVVKQAGETRTYALKIDDFNTFNTTMQQKFSSKKSEKIFNEDYLEEINKKAKDLGGAPALYQKAFLQFLSDQNLGLSLYEMEQTGAGTSNVQENWKKLELNQNGSITATPCN